MQLAYAAFLELPGKTEILVSACAWQAFGIAAGAADGWHHQIAGAQVGRTLSGFHHFAKAFMAKHKEIASFGRRAILEPRNFHIGPAHTNFPHSHYYLVAARSSWRLNRCHGNPFLVWEDGKSFHNSRISVGDLFRAMGIVLPA